MQHSIRSRKGLGLLLALTILGGSALAATPATTTTPVANKFVSNGKPLFLTHPEVTAVSACTGKAVNISCSFTEAKGTVSGFCVDSHDKYLACLPKF